MVQLSRRTLLAGSTVGSVLYLTGCSPQTPRPPAGSPAASGGATAAVASSEPVPDDTHAVTLRIPEADTVLPLDESSSSALTAALIESATAVVVAMPAAVATPSPSVSAAEASPSTSTSANPVTTTQAPDPLASATDAALALGLPLLLAGPSLLGELDRLQTRTVIGYPAEGLDVGDRELIPGTDDPSALPELPGLPRVPQPSAVAVYTDTDELTPEVRAVLSAAGATPIRTISGHPGESAESVAAAKTGESVVALGASFVDATTLAARVAVARTAPELPGGGVTPFPGRRMIALYGHPGAPVLGMMGEQSPEESVARVQKLVAEYQALRPEENFIGAFEIITTIASASAGSDGNYSILSSFERVLPFIEAAEANDIYVVLDLQPGRSTFLEQAKRYEELLKRPWVGLALDPEWRLQPGQRHMVQIGQVEIEEVNEVGAWLAQLVRDNNLPPKVLTLHQFQPRMIINRELLDTTHDEIQYLVHVDGLGSQGAKQGTWQRILQDLPPRVYVGWKNFEDEDLPMLTPAQTLEQVIPMPHFVSYQ